MASYIYIKGTDRGSPLFLRGDFVLGLDKKAIGNFVHIRYRDFWPSIQVYIQDKWSKENKAVPGNLVWRDSDDRTYLSRILFDVFKIRLGLLGWHREHISKD